MSVFHMDGKTMLWFYFRKTFCICTISTNSISSTTLQYYRFPFLSDRKKVAMFLRGKAASKWLLEHSRRQIRFRITYQLSWIGVCSHVQDCISKVRFHGADGIWCRSLRMTCLVARRILWEQWIQIMIIHKYFDSSEVEGGHVIFTYVEDSMIQY